MAVTIQTITTSDSDYELIEDKYSWNVGYNPDFRVLEPVNEESMSFYSDQTKMIMRLPISFYHCMHDFLGTVFHIFELDPDTLFIIDVSIPNRTPVTHKVNEFCFKLLDYHNVNYEKVDLTKGSSVNIDNFYIRTQRVVDHNASNILMKYIMPFIKNQDVKPFRKVYLSRKGLTNYKNKQYGEEFSKKLTRNTYNRIDDEEKLENFFLDNGFEVMIPEDFDSFEDQLNYFYEVDTIVGITGGGLTNVMFMQPGGTVIELMTTLITNVSHVNYMDKTENRFGFEEGQHHFYHAIAFRKNCNYFGFPNINTEADTLIKRIVSTPAFNFIDSRNKDE